MARLHLEMSPLITQSVIENLGRHKILTVVDILQEEPLKLARFSKMGFKDVCNLRDTLIANYSPFPQQGLDIYHECESNSVYIKSGIKSLDRLLNGGFSSGSVYEICGMSGVGKTQLCLTLVINGAQQQRGKVHFIDTKGDFSGKRILSMLDARGIGLEETGVILEQILVTKVHNFYDLYTSLYNLKDQLIKEPGSTRFVIVESLPAVFLQFMGNSKMDSLGLMNCLASLIKYIAQEQHVSFVLVNLATKWIEDDSAPLTDCDYELTTSTSSADIKPVLGKYWVHIPSTRLYIEREGEPHSRKISIVKSSHLPVGKFCAVRIENKGVV